MPRRALAVALVLLACAVAAIYAPSGEAALIWDDHYLVEQDTRCRDDLLACFGVSYIPASPFLDVSTVYYRPVVTASFAVVTRLGGGARGQHLFNVALHVVNALLLAALAHRFGATRWRAAALALAWAAHPRLVEAVTWISGRTDLLAASCVLGALAAWPGRTGEPWSDRDKARAGLAAVLVLLGLFAKEVALAAVLAIVATSWRNGRARAAILAAPVAIYALCRLSVVGTKLPPSSITTAQHLATVPEAAARYVDMTVRAASPWSLHGAIGVPSTAYVVLGVVVLAALGLGAIRAARSGAEGTVLGATLGITSLLAVLQIVPIGLHGAVTGDRLLYLPLAGAIVVLATTIPARLDRFVIGAALAAAAIATPFTRRAEHVFDDEVEFWLTLAERADAPNAGPPSAVATIVRDRGRPELACPLFDATRRLLERTGRRASPAFGRASENLAACWARTGRYDDAVDLYRAIAKERPQSGRVALGLAYALLHQLDFDGAKAAFARAATLDPKLAERAREELADVDKAVAARARARAHEERGTPQDEARFLGSVGRAPEAERAWLAILRDPDAPPPLRVEAAGVLAGDGSPEAAAEVTKVMPGTPLAQKASTRASLAASVDARKDRVVRLGTR